MRSDLVLVNGDKGKKKSLQSDNAICLLFNRKYRIERRKQKLTRVTFARRPLSYIPTPPSLPHPTKPSKESTPWLRRPEAHKRAPQSQPHRVPSSSSVTATLGRSKPNKGGESRITRKFAARQRLGRPQGQTPRLRPHGPIKRPEVGMLNRGRSATNG